MEFFQPIFRFISKTIQDTTIVTTEDEQELVCDLSLPLSCRDREVTCHYGHVNRFSYLLSNAAISNDLE